ncbi:protein TIC 62, chloroplastic isoform X2 [Diospyros lotus]|uniref:protein TIC 62, chloroplastic isoform X2 n=1 Tax=Diospyros lotus TaxID=55363 RepID=UPI00225C16AD|nr:protein TIC 62, chloroplastic isoform X2 [Diospyros lotus]
MELHSLQSSSPVTGIPSALTQLGLREKKLLLSGQVIGTPNFKRNPDTRKLKLLGYRAQASGSIKFSATAVEAIPKDSDLKDENLVFVAGATGRVGSRTVRELLKLGFNVRAGVRSVQRAEPLLQSVQQMKLDSEAGSEGTKPIEKLEIVECDLEKQDQIGPALGRASVVVCCIGASEKEVFDISGPYRIDYQATKNLIDAATTARVNHFILLTSLGTNKIGFPAAILNLFWGVLIWKRKAEEALLASGLPYTIVRPGGMERPTDAYKETHNITLSEADTLFGGQVSNLQVAELMAFMAKNRSLSCCKVVEVIAETTAPLTPLGDLLVKIPSQLVEAKPLKKESDAVGGSQPAASMSAESETPSAPAEKEPTKAQAEAARPLSPYTAYEDLKPPSSPSPTPSGPREDNLSFSSAEVVPETSGNDVAKVITTSSVETGPSQNLDSYQSPYYVYDDLKPPTSPSPNAPNGTLLVPSSSNDGSLKATVPINITAESPPADKPQDERRGAEPKRRPLSPFTMYPDLKPPTSPGPPRNL